MAATTTVSITSLIKKLRGAYPHLDFIRGEDFHYTPPGSITYDPTATDSCYMLLHEVGHVLSKHYRYTRDVELLAIESQAWEQAIIVAKTLDISIPDSVIQSSLDTYRDWMHARSLCPECSTTGVQPSSSPRFSCIACGTEWSVNSARLCELRRHIL